jgi:hypothetical protein
VVERCRADHQVERRVRERQPLGGTLDEAQPRVAGLRAGLRDHPGRGVDSGQLGRARQPPREFAQQQPGAAAHIEYPSWGWPAGQRQVRRAHDDIGVQLTAVTHLITR